MLHSVVEVLKNEIVAENKEYFYYTDTIRLHGWTAFLPNLQFCNYSTFINFVSVKLFVATVLKSKLQFKRHS